MANSSSTATVEAPKSTTVPSPPAPDLQRTTEPEVDQSLLTGQRVMRAIGGGSPETPPDRFSEALSQSSTAQATGMLRQLQRSYGNQYVSSVIQRKGEGAINSVPEGFEAAMQRSGSGQPMDEGTRSFMESRFNQDFSNVRIHADSAAADASRQIQAQAFTTKRDIYFGQNRYQPQTTAGQKLIAHELAHVVQQAGVLRAKPTINQPGEAWEQEAETISEQVIAENTNTLTILSPVTSAAIQRQHSSDDLDAGVPNITSSPADAGLPGGVSTPTQTPNTPTPAPIPAPPVVLQDQNQTTPQTPEAVLQLEINRYGDRCFNNLNANFNNAISLFQNWYFDKTEGDTSFFTEFKTLVSHASDFVVRTGTLLESRITSIFNNASTSLSIDRMQFLTSLNRCISSFNQQCQTQLIGRTTEYLRNNSAGWSNIVNRYTSGGDWQQLLHQEGLPSLNNNLQSRLLSELIFAYRRWELNQHTDLYRGVYSMADPDLRHMRTGAESEAQSLLQNPRINYGDVVISIPNQILLEERQRSIANSFGSVGDVSVRFPLFEAIGINLRGSIGGGYEGGVGFGPIVLQNIRLGLGYATAGLGLFSPITAASFAISPFATLRSLSYLTGTRFRAAAELYIPASARLELYLRAALGLGVDLGLSEDISVNLASIGGHLEARAGAFFTPEFRGLVDIIIDHGQMSFTNAQSLDLSSGLGFRVTGEINARVLTFTWRKSWDLFNAQWSNQWNISSNMNLLYVNGIQGDPERVIEFNRLASIASQFQSIGSAVMNFSGPGSPPPTPTPNARVPLRLRWPKPRARDYPKLYLTRRGETRSQTTLKNLYPGDVEDGGRRYIIERFSPIEQKALPYDSRQIGLDPYNQLSDDNNYIGPLRATPPTPGGRKINDLVSPYGIDPSVLNGDHVREFQLGGEDEVNNLWPLPASLNKSAGSAVNQAIVIDPSTSPPQQFRISFLKQVIVSNPTNYFFEIISFL